MKIENVLEGIVGSLLIIILAIVLIPKEKVTNEPVIIEDTFNQYPLIAWKDTDKKGDIIKEHMLTTKRPSIGIPPNEFDYVLGKKLNKDIENDSTLFWDDLD